MKNTVGGSYRRLLPCSVVVAKSVVATFAGEPHGIRSGGMSRSVANTCLSACVAVAVPLLPVIAGAAVIDFETPSLGALTHQADYNAAGGFNSGGAFFNNSYTDYGGGAFGWSGFALSRETDIATSVFGNQFSAASGAGSGGSLQYAVSYVDSFAPAPRITFATGEIPLSLRVVNTTYAALSMRDGDSFAKKFGGVTGSDADFFKLTIAGRNAADQPTGSVDFYLADYRFANNAQDYIVTTWTNVDVSSFGAATRALTFALTSSDNGQFGMNTPAYFAVDQVATVPEPTTGVLCGLALSVMAACRRRK